MSDEPTPAQRLTPTKHMLGVGGLATFGTGGCLIWTIILIPLAIPLLSIGLVMMIWSLFVQTEPMVCPYCATSHMVEQSVIAGICPACRQPFKRSEAGGWERIA